MKALIGWWSKSYARSLKSAERLSVIEVTKLSSRADQGEESFFFTGGGHA
jgi:hypothetical protein